MTSLNDYQKGTRETSKYPGFGEGNWLALSYLGLGLGEAGEVQGKLKKVLRDDDGKVTWQRKGELIGELGDLLWYVARVADELGVDLETIGTMNLDKLRSRAERGVIGGSGDTR